MNYVVIAILCALISVVCAYIVTKTAFRNYVTFGHGAFALFWPVTFPTTASFIAYHCTCAVFHKGRQKVSEIAKEKTVAERKRTVVEKKMTTAREVSPKEIETKAYQPKETSEGTAPAEKKPEDDFPD